MDINYTSIVQNCDDDWIFGDILTGSFRTRIIINWNRRIVSRRGVAKWGEGRGTRYFQSSSFPVEDENLLCRYNMINQF